MAAPVGWNNWSAGGSGSSQHDADSLRWKVKSRSSNISNLGVAPFAAASIVSWGIGAFTRNEHLRETGILTAEAERYVIPFLGGPLTDVMTSLQVTFNPKNWIRHR